MKAISPRQYRRQKQGKEGRVASPASCPKRSPSTMMSVAETITFYARLKKVPSADFSDLLARLSLMPDIEKPIRDLSWGSHNAWLSPGAARRPPS
ncbi:MAG: hypothetical protein M5U34_15895 [Chloroflexi bacterium]|nr:hypothetical protein [Chloroflexota bacterium]